MFQHVLEGYNGVGEARGIYRRPSLECCKRIMFAKLSLKPEARVICSFKGQFELFFFHTLPIGTCFRARMASCTNSLEGTASDPYIHRSTVVNTYPAPLQPSFSSRASLAASPDTPLQAHSHSAHRTNHKLPSPHRFQPSHSYSSSGQRVLHQPKLRPNNRPSGHGTGLPAAPVQDMGSSQAGHIGFSALQSHIRNQ
jgi:hypothetical protein